jgi:hypothetical protein
LSDLVRGHLHRRYRCGDHQGVAVTLREQRCLFTRLICEFGLWAFQQGYELAFGEVVRTKAQAQQNAGSGTGISNSLHLDGLAVDFNLYINGVYQESSEAHAPLGAQWKSMHSLCRWGGDFRKPDGNHYSLEHNGRA